MKKQRIRWWAVLVWLAVWQLASMAVHQEIFLVSPLRALSRLMELLFQLEFWHAVGYTLARIALGFSLGLLTAVILAYCAGRWRWVDEVLAPLMLTVKSVPVASFIILALICFSSRHLSVLISFLMVLPVLYINTLEGIRAVDPALMEMTRVFHIPFFRALRYVVVPQAWPYFLSGCRVALGLCWKAGVAAEVIGIPKGSIGEQLQQAKVYLETPDLFAWTAMIVLLSVAFERVTLWLLEQLRRRLERM